MTQKSKWNELLMKQWFGIFALIIAGALIISASSPSGSYDTGNKGGYIFGGCLVLFGIFFAIRAIFKKNS